MEIYIKANINKIILKKKKKIYKKDKNLVGINIKPEFPKKPHIIINNNLNNSLEKLKKELLNKISKKLKKKKII